jgi:hypothetical protein
MVPTDDWGSGGFIIVKETTGMRGYASSMKLTGDTWRIGLEIL